MNDFRKPVGVQVTSHAVERFHQRFPGEVSAYPEIKGVVYREVQAALTAGRRTSSMPKWCSGPGHARGRHRAVRFVFNEEQTRCYAIIQDGNRDRERAHEFGISWVVLTTLSRLDETAIAEVDRLDQLDRRTGRDRISKRTGRRIVMGRRR